MISRFRESFSWEKAAIAFLFLVGIVLRLRQYLTGRSLWVDEAMLALNIVNRPIGGMFRPLDYDQGSPIGFLLVEKVFHLLLGRSEYALRLFPLLLGILCLWLFYLLLKRVTSGAGLLAAFALFVFNPQLIYYSSEVKQYILDVTAALVLLLVAAPLLENGAEARRRDFAWLAVTGFFAIWFSHPAVFVLAAIGLALLIDTLRRRDRAHLWYVLGTGIFWLITIGLLYLLILSDLRQNEFMQEYWQDAFVPMPPWSDPGWFARSLHENVSLQFGFPYAVYLVVAFMLAGWFMLWQTKRNYAITFGFLLLITLAASAMRLYPVYERMILFLVPIGLLLLGVAVEAIQRKIQRPRWAGTLVTLALAGFLIVQPLVTSLGFFLEPKYREHIRPTMKVLQESWRPGDAMYISQGAVPAFEYYAPVYGLAAVEYVSGDLHDLENPAGIAMQLGTLKGNPRVWILMSHVYEKGEFNEKDFILNELRQMGRKKREFHLQGIPVYLYLFELQK